VGVELIAHRGASRERRENTLPAFTRALELGADGIELDVHASSDGVVIVHHDAMPRAESPSPALRGRAFTELTAREISGFRFADGSRIPTLAQVIDLVGDRATLYVELKGRGIERSVLDTLRDSKTRHAVHSFDHASVKHVGSLSGTTRTGILLASYLVEPERALETAGARDYWQSNDLVDEALVSRVHAAGGRVIVWTVNQPSDAAALAAMGVDGVCTDDLRAVGAALGRAVE
jgi:glycerophosphoryl diester phosphodiesterase